MSKSIRSTVLLVLTSSTFTCFADAPITGMYIIKTSDLLATLKEKANLSNFKQSDLEKISEYTASVGQSVLTDFRITTPTLIFAFSSNYGSWPPPLPGTGCAFRLNISNRINSDFSITLTDSLVYTNDTLKQSSFDQIAIHSMPNTSVRVNKNWRTQHHTLLVIFVNAKR